MKFEQVTDGFGNGTCLKLYTKQLITAQQIIDVFGEGIGAGDKTQYEWVFRDEDDNRYTVYDWKNYGGLSPDTPYDWHIGGPWQNGGDVEAFKEWFLQQVVGVKATVKFAGVKATVWRHSTS